MAITVITPPTVEPVNLDEAKLQCRIDLDDDDALIDGLIMAAREYVERVAGRALITQTLELVMDQFPASETIEMPMAPLQSVTSITYTDSNGTTSTVSAASYIVDTDSQPGRITLKSGYAWPSATLQSINGVRVRFVAGYGLASAVPQKFKQAVLLLVGHWYENREQATIGSGSLQNIPFGVQALLWVDRIKVF